ncbi:Ras guanyl-nucleotide exchange factor [Niveomyces insectorum RCEF 264]|uniref:Ras guanyl-nucleotide exchange factor n=1 Tax=Niveomyces insectorum RCEF 264 TaxID=1081102 RepID=A0A167SS32_9HYPO|nr:Ras guanyl-nucleotide exchange factor [Niveomyces insectorum RCEF 264]
MSSPAHLRALYRAFLRELPPPAPPVRPPRSPLQIQLRAALEGRPVPGSPAAASASSDRPPTGSLALAAQYLTYLQAQRTHTTLLERYNPALGIDMDEATRVRLTARRVGMDLPVEVQLEEKGDGGHNGKGDKTK